MKGNKRARDGGRENNEVWRRENVKQGIRNKNKHIN